MNMLLLDIIKENDTFLKRKLEYKKLADSLRLISRCSIPI